MRRISPLALIASAIIAICGSCGHAAHLSASNPYRSFNSGVNYGAQQWEHSHHCHVRGHGRR